MRPLRLIALSAALAWSTPALATNVDQKLDDQLQGTGGVKLNAVTLQATRYTGWIDVQQMAELVLEIDWTDGNGTVTEIEMLCRISNTNTGANGTGRKITVALGADSTGEDQFKQHKWSWTFTEGNDNWEWVIRPSRGKYVNCSFSAGTGASGSSDSLTVRVQGGTP